MYACLSLFDFLFVVILSLVNVAFITLLERKVLSYSQSRLGPNKPSFAGILQPGADAIKLFVKNSGTLVMTISFMFWASPLLGLGVVLGLFALAPLGSSAAFKFPFLLLCAGMSLSVYPVLMAGWASNSKYAMLGAMRSIAQTISYEISFALSVMVLILLSGAHTYDGVLGLNSSLLLGVCFPGLTLLFVVAGLAETNRTPFDFSEGESELVSGFNVEYGGGGFAIIFMSEYASIYFFSLIVSGFFMASSGLLVSFVVFVWVWVRTTFPRYRYDLLMALAWKTLLPVTLSLLVVSISLC